MNLLIEACYRKFNSLISFFMGGLTPILEQLVFMKNFSRNRSLIFNGHKMNGQTT